MWLPSHRCPECDRFVQAFVGEWHELRTPECPLCGHLFDTYVPGADTTA
jgi:hypothetical protein